MINVFAGSVLATVATIDPQTIANTERFSDVVDMSKFDQVLATLLTGDEAAETIDFKCYTCAADGTGAAALKTATQLAAHATANDNAQVVMAVKAGELAASGARYVKFGVVTGNTAGGPAAVLVQGIASRYGLASDNDLATVKQIKQ